MIEINARVAYEVTNDLAISFGCRFISTLLNERRERYF
jgi:hypothetical protein